MSERLKSLFYGKIDLSRESPMPAPRQLELYPARKRTAAERRAIIRKRLEGLEYRQRAREERRRNQLERRRAREAGQERDLAAQVTLEELIERSRAAAGV